jgi:Mor family transcriptional regulator
MSRQAKYAKNTEGERNGHSKLTEAQVAEMRELYESEKKTIRQLAKQYRMSYTGIHNIVKGKYWDLPLAD